MMLQDTHSALPLTEATFCILLSLVDGPRHGYAIMQDVELLSDGRIRLSTGTLYGALKRLLDFGWIEPLPSPTSPTSARETRTYQLTTQGIQVFKAEQERMYMLLQTAQRRLAGSGL